MTRLHFTVRASGGDTWESVGELATILQGLGPPDVPLTEMSSTTVPAGGVDGGLVPLRLTEDTFLRGYEPLLPAHSVITYAPPTAHTVSVLSYYFLGVIDILINVWTSLAF